MQLGPAEILVVLVIALLVFGPNKLPEVGRQVGRAMKEFRQFQQTMSRDMHDVFSDDASAGDASAGAEPAPMLPPKAVVPDTDVIDSGMSDADVIDAASSEVPPTEPHSSEVSSDATPIERPGTATTDPETSA